MRIVSYEDYDGKCNFDCGFFENISLKDVFMRYSLAQIGMNNRLKSSFFKSSAFMTLSVVLVFGVNRKHGDLLIDKKRMQIHTAIPRIEP